MPRPMPGVPGVSHGEVLVDGVALHVAEAGRGTPVILLHGWPQHWWCWRKVIGPLATRHRVICPDLRGFGWSAAPARGYEKERLASDLLGLLDALELALPGSGTRVGLVGHDWGGFAGFLACLRAPERFSAFLALSITHPWPSAHGGTDPGQLLRLAYMPAVANPLSPLALRRPQITRRLFASATAAAWEPPVLEEYMQALAQPGSARASSALYRSFLLQEVLPLARGRYRDRRLEVPTVLLIGQDDPYVNAETLAGFERHASQMGLSTASGAGHWLPEERPERVIEEFERLLEAAGDRRAP